MKKLIKKLIKKKVAKLLNRSIVFNLNFSDFGGPDAARVFETPDLDNL